MAQISLVLKLRGGKGMSSISVFCSSTKIQPDPAEFQGNSVFMAENGPLKHTAWTFQRANSSVLLSLLYS